MCLYKAICALQDVSKFQICLIVTLALGLLLFSAHLSLILSNERET